jgi:hypothetical protein
MGVLQLLDEDETTVLFDFHDPTGAANPGTRVVVAPGTTIGRTLALVTERVDPSQQRRSLEAGAVSELQGIARFKTTSAHLLSMSDLASRGSIALR